MASRIHPGRWNRVSLNCVTVTPLTYYFKRILHFFRSVAFSASRAFPYRVRYWIPRELFRAILLAIERPGGVVFSEWKKRRFVGRNQLPHRAASQNIGVGGRETPCQTAGRTENRIKQLQLTMNMKPNGKSRIIAGWVAMAAILATSYANTGIMPVGPGGCLLRLQKYEKEH